MKERAFEPLRTLEFKRYRLSEPSNLAMKSSVLSCRMSMYTDWFVAGNCVLLLDGASVYFRSRDVSVCTVSEGVVVRSNK